MVVENRSYSPHVVIREGRSNDGIIDGFRKCGIGGCQNGDVLRCLISDVREQIRIVFGESITEAAKILMGG